MSPKERLGSRLFWGGVSTLLFPALLVKSAVTPSWRLALGERLGLGGWSKLDRSDTSQYLWFHAASLGEVDGIAPLLKKIKERKPELKLLVTTTSLTGRDKVRELKIADEALFLPFDHPAIWRKVLPNLNLKALVITETELWPNLLLYAAKLKLPVLLINARVSDYSFPNYLRFRKLLLPSLDELSVVLAQTELDATRFALLGISPAKIRVAGSTKYDRAMPTLAFEEQQAFLGELGLTGEQKILVAGSVREGEDQTVIEAYKLAQATDVSLQLVIVPRHPERFEEVAKLLTAAGLSFNRRSLGAVSERKPIVLLDTLGELTKAYSISSFAFVGGSLVDIGGHNPLEPAAFKVPVLVGPYTSNVRDAVHTLKEQRALFEVKDARELAQTVLELSGDEKLRASAGQGAFEVWQSNLGATARVLAEIEPYFSARKEG